MTRYRKRPEPERLPATRTLSALAVLVAVLAGALIWQKAGYLAFRDIGGANDIQVGEIIHVTSVHDGDTFRLGAERVRIIGVDAPEIGERANCTAEQVMALRAPDYLSAALASNNVRIVRHGHGVYGRTLAYVYVDGHDIADAMLAAGLAKPYVRGTHGEWYN